MTQRPPLASIVAGEQLRRWYWTMAELQEHARSVGVRAAGPKSVLVDRMAAQLDGQGFEEPAKRRTRAQLSGPLDESTVIPTGQRSSNEVRAFFVDRIGPSFRFNGHMRAFLAASNGATLGDAVDHWYSTVGTELPTQSQSLEFNRFTKQWHHAHPDGSADEARAAWARFRALPVDERPPVDGAS